MKFLCLGYYDAGSFDSTPKEERDAVMEKCYAQCVPFRATGKVVEEEALDDLKSAKCIRPRNGKPVVTDGPFIETKEQVGSFFVIEAANIDEAVQVASLHPAALMGEKFGFGIEVRPIQL